MSFEFNCKYYPYVFYKEDVNSRFKSKAADELTEKLRILMAIYRKKLQHIQELQKQSHNMETMSKSYVPNKKVWLNSKYIKTKRNRKLEAKFFRSFRVLHPVAN